MLGKSTYSELPTSLARASNYVIFMSNRSQYHFLLADNGVTSTSQPPNLHFTTPSTSYFRRRFLFNINSVTKPHLLSLLHDLDMSFEKKSTVNENVKAEVTALIEKYRNSNEAPSFSGAELIVMAAVCIDKSPVKLREVVDWILKTFRYYNDQVVREYMRASYSSLPYYPPTVAPELFEGLDCWDAPINNAEWEQVIINEDEISLRRLIIVDPEKARIFLRRWLEPERKGTFRFLDLPAEIRNTIYGMVFGLHVTIHMDQYEKPEAGHGATVLKREDDTVDDTEARSHAIADAFETAPMQIVLALLSVNKQIHREAMAEFYQTNSFCIIGIAKLNNLVTSMSPIRFQWLGRINLRIDYKTLGRHDISMSEWITATTALSQLQRLQRLKIDFEGTDDGWKNLPLRVRREVGIYRKFSSPEQLLGMRSLAIAASKAADLEVVGCSSLAEYVLGAVEKLKDAKALDEELPKNGRKRKSRDAATQMEREDSTRKGRARMKK
jgi:hypothetical protein